MVNLPTDENRQIIFGRTGSGKTVFAMDQLSRRSFDRMPWIGFNYKGDRMMNQLVGLGYPEIDIHKKPPTKPGLYLATPDPNEPAAMNDFLMKVWAQEETGLYFDEGFMAPQKRPFKAFDHIMTQGRSKRIPVVMCYQRPRELSTFALASAEFIVAFNQIKPEDREYVGSYMSPVKGPNGETIDVNTKLPKHWSLYYDVDEDEATLLRPCPAPDAIIEVFDNRLIKRRKGLFG